MELFDSHEGLMLCEIADRTGGTRFNDIVIKYLGMDLEKEACLGQLNIPYADSIIVQEKIDELFGFIIFPRIGGILVKAPTSCPIHNAVDYRLYYKAGTYIASKKCTNCVADMLFYAYNEEELNSIIEEAIDWYNTSFEWLSNEVCYSKE